MNKFMQAAIKEAKNGIELNHGGPFGAVVVKDGKIIGRGHNQVVSNNDPTCHGEVDAIRNACSNLRSFDLQGAVTSTLPANLVQCALEQFYGQISIMFIMDTQSRIMTK